MSRASRMTRSVAGMTVTFDQARVIVADALTAVWTEDDGTLITLAHGWEDATHWHVIVGASEWLVGRDVGFCQLGGPSYLVDKASGEIMYLHVMSNFERLDAMTPVGEDP